MDDLAAVNGTEHLYQLERPVEEAVSRVEWSNSLIAPKVLVKSSAFNKLLNDEERCCSFVSLFVEVNGRQSFVEYLRYAGKAAQPLKINKLSVRKSMKVS